MREQIADIFGVEEERVAVIPNGIDPDDLQPHDEPELRRLRAEFAAPDEKLVLLIGRLVYEKGFQLALEAMPRADRGASRGPASWSRARAPTSASCAGRPPSSG